MKIAIVATPENPVPPEGYGGGERVVDVMVHQLIEHGHEVDLYAHPDSTSPATRIYKAPTARMSAEETLSQWVGDKTYDCILDRAALHLSAQKYDNAVGIMAGDPFKRYPHDQVKNKVYVSREFAWFCGRPNHPVLRNPVCNDPWSLPLGRGEGGYALFVGPIHPMKGIDLAIAACRALDMDLRVYGPIRSKEYAEWLTERGMNYHGILGQDGRDDVFGQAKVFLHPTKVCDADPGAPKEAMLHGTPVVATPEGGIRSRIIPGATGFFAYSVRDYIDAIQKIDGLDRDKVRQVILSFVDPNVFGDRVEFLCNKIIEGDRW